MKRKFKHRKLHYYDAFDRLFNRLLKTLVKSGCNIECCGLIDCKPMLSESEKETFLATLDKAKEEIYKQRAEEFNKRVILDNFIFKINEEAVKDVFEKDLLEVKEL